MASISLAHSATEVRGGTRLTAAARNAEYTETAGRDLQLYADMDEHQIQVALFRAYKQRRMPGAIMFAIPNGGARDKVTAKRLKDEGVTAGAPDIFCSSLSPAGRFLMELKTVKGTLSRAQKKFHPMLVAAGVEVVVCRGFLAAIHCLEERGIIRLPNTGLFHAESMQTSAKAGRKGAARLYS